jgi:hypothetical protein
VADKYFEAVAHEVRDDERLRHRHSKLPKEPKDQNYHEDEAQNAARTAGPISTIAVSAAAEENDK